jgi:hypothetical protein
MPIDLWPADLNATVPDTPVSVIRAQANVLTERTEKQIVGEVNSIRSANDTNFKYSFDLYVPAIRYRYTLFTLSYGIQGYPVEISPDAAIAKEIASPDLFFLPLNAASEAEFVSILEKIFRAETTRRAINSLLGHIESEGKGRAG